ncbi:hypothetical protein ACWEPL_59330 [Nonomuraea sp. NPDC004186]
MFEQIAAFNDTITERRADPDPQVRATVKYRRPTSIATTHRIRATLRHALNMAMRQDLLIDFNPAAVLEMPAPTRPKPLVWTDDRVLAWQADNRSYWEGEKQRRRRGRARLCGRPGQNVRLRGNDQHRHLLRPLTPEIDSATSAVQATLRHDDRTISAYGPGDVCGNDPNAVTVRVCQQEKAAIGSFDLAVR